MVVLFHRPYDDGGRERHSLAVTSTSRPSSERRSLMITLSYLIGQAIRLYRWLHPEPYRRTRQRYFEAWPTTIPDWKEGSM